MSRVWQTKVTLWCCARTRITIVLDFSLRGSYVVFDVEKKGKPEGGYVDLTI
jgi:hypothetical protein